MQGVKINPYATQAYPYRASRRKRALRQAPRQALQAPRLGLGLGQNETLQLQTHEVSEILSLSPLDGNTAFPLLPPEPRETHDVRSLSVLSRRRPQRHVEIFRQLHLGSNRLEQSHGLALSNHILGLQRIHLEEVQTSISIGHPISRKTPPQATATTSHAQSPKHGPQTHAPNPQPGGGDLVLSTLVYSVQNRTLRGAKQKRPQAPHPMEGHSLRPNGGNSSFSGDKVYLD